MTVNYEWRGAFANREINELHAEAFATRVFTTGEWDWAAQVDQHSLGWVVARSADGTLAGFVNVISDGLIHAWVQDTMVAATVGRQGVGTQLIGAARAGALAAGCEWLHVDFDDHLRSFYFDACGFRPTNGGLIVLQD